MSPQKKRHESSSMKCFRLFDLYLHRGILYLYINERINFFCSLRLHRNDPFYSCKYRMCLLSSSIRHCITQNKTKIYANAFPLPAAVLSELRVEKKTLKSVSTAGVCCFTTHDGVFHTWSSCHTRVEETRIYQRENCDSVFAISSCCILHSVDDFPK